MKPREAYKQRVFLNEQSLRMLKAEKRLSMKGKTEKVSAVLVAYVFRHVVTCPTYQHLSKMDKTCHDFGHEMST